MPSSDVPPDAVQPETRAGWRAWLARNYARQSGVWVVMFKKAAGPVPVTYDDVVDEALCFGWIDSKPRKLDEARTMLWVSPRRAGSGWSGVNKRRLERLAAAGLIEAPGHAAIDAAKADGSWTKLDRATNLEVPGDLATALAACEGARTNFDAFPPSARRSILEWITAAKRAETRAARIAETARLAGTNIRANQWSPKSSGSPGSS